MSANDPKRTLLSLLGRGILSGSFTFPTSRRSISQRDGALMGGHLRVNA